MYFQIFDAKEECKSVLANGVIHDSLSEGMTHTWSYSPHLRDKDIRYAEVWSRGLTLDEACPDNLKDEWHALNLKTKAFIKSMHTS